MADEPTAGVPVEDQDDDEEATRKATFAVPAPYCDAYYLTTWPGHIRMSFGEYYDRPYYRTAVVMSLDDVESFLKSLTKVVERQREKDKVPKAAD